MSLLIYEIKVPGDHGRRRFEMITLGAKPDARLKYLMPLLA